MTATVFNDANGVSIERPALYLIATPIGNLADISVRALQTLSNVDVILAEDKRVSRRLLTHYGITTRMLALHDHNEARIAETFVLDALKDNLAVAQISDAGTPLISDPGFKLVNVALDKGLAVYSVPGACAAIAALSVSGLATDEFVFVGFLHSKSSARQHQLEALKHERRTMIFYESPHRILRTLQAIADIFGSERQVVVARELTKMYETVYRGQVSDLMETARNDPNFSKGEIVMMVAGAEIDSTLDDHELNRVMDVLLEDLPASQAIKLASKITGAKKNHLYQLVNDRDRSTD